MNDFELRPWMQDKRNQYSPSAPTKGVSYITHHLLDVISLLDQMT